MFTLMSILVACSDTCGDDQICKVADGEYQAQAPSSWKSLGRLPVAFHFYGYQGSPEKAFDDSQSLAEFAEAGVLYVAPEDEGGWTFDGQDSGAGWNGRDDSVFLAQILDDLDERWGIDRDRLFLTGHSTGASSVHDLVCLEPGVWAAAAPFSGVFWEPIPESCVTPAIPIRHTHGLADSTWPWEGRSFGANATQGDVSETMAFWVQERECSDQTTTETVSVATCETWTGCLNGTDLALCVHEGGHAKPDDWAATSMAWMLEI
jgi:polyhydroxybutyrate depolymerase